MCHICSTTDCYCVNFDAASQPDPEKKRKEKLHCFFAFCLKWHPTYPHGENNV